MIRTENAPNQSEFCRRLSRSPVLLFMASRGWGGAERSFRDLCIAMNAYVDVHVVVLTDSWLEAELEGRVPIHPVRKGRSRWNPLLWAELLFIIHAVDPVLIHCHSGKATEIVYRLSKLAPLPPLVGTKRNTRKGTVFNRIKHPAAISEAVKQTIDHASIAVLHNGLEPDPRVAPSRAENRLFTLLAAGRLDPVKGFDRLIEQCSHLSFPFCLKIVGDGPEGDSLAKLATRLGLEEHVQFLGYRPCINELIASADVVVVSSVHEGFSRIILESLFYGNLLVSTRVGIATETLDSRFLADHCELAQKLTEIYKNLAQHQNDFAELAEKQRSRFTLEASVQRHLLFYRSILEKW